MIRSLLLSAALLTACSPAPVSQPAPAASPAFPDGELVDLSHAYDNTTIFWPTSERFRLDKVADGVTPAGHYYAANNFSTSEHGGTHIDSPVHFVQVAQTVDQIPLDRLVGLVVIVDVVA